jgi:hypothetical protein
MKGMALYEAYRTVIIRDDEGRAVPASIIQAILRSQIKLAINGNVPAQRAFLSTIRTFEEEAWAEATCRPQAEGFDDEDLDDEDLDDENSDAEDPEAETPDRTEADPEHGAAAEEPPSPPRPSGDEPPVRPFKRKPGPPPVRPDRYARRSIFKVGGRRIRQARMCRRNAVFRAENTPFCTGRSVRRHSPILRTKMAASGEANGAETPQNRKRLVLKLFAKGIEAGRPLKPQHPRKMQIP